AVVGGNLASGIGECAVISAGSSDYPVAEEAAVSLEYLGIKAWRFYDRGVAGLHRLSEPLEVINGRPGMGVIVVAGMEGALPSVVSAQISQPVVAVPTSIGYGSSFQGLSALLGMLNTCSPGVAVVNIDNGFGAAVVVYRMLTALTAKR
ncbi:MAG: nickel pincer cofactor biosynthesis protein LarB, partial [Thermoplasmata archaeon]|nr:nickel pincer cofactor biosynthesis protein LarB [Thermoplasmata archaeon]